MNPVSVSFSFLLHIIFVWLFWASLFITGHGSEIDEEEIHCLKSIKQSIDPFNHLSNWDFNTNSKGFNFCGFSGVECSNIDEQRAVSSLNLSNMGLKGPFPQGIENCSSLQILDLSKNEISGEIPKFVANLYSLVNLKLDNNQLSGEIPHEIGLLPQIESFNVENNFLSGEAPVFTRSFHVVSFSYANNNGLCGGYYDLEPCDDDERSSDRSFWYSFAIAYVCSATSVIVSFMYYCQPWRVLKKRRANSVSSFRRKRQNIVQPRTTEIAELLPMALQEQRTKEVSEILERLISRIDFGELCEATNYFSTDNVLGFGRTGIVYKAKLPNNYFMAVKRLYDSQLHKREFLLETMIPGKHKHHNIVPILGFCLQKKESLLVYEHMSNGNLQDWLLQSESSDDEPNQYHQDLVLEWPIRVYIALGLARTLSWLHNKCNIVHLNLSSECVLLSKDFEPKVSNFGKAKFINVQKINGRLRMNLYVINGVAEKGSVEKDVYDFGVILVELITGKRLNIPTAGSSSSDDDDSVGFCSLMKSIRSCDFENVIDKFLIGKGFDEKIFGMIEVACDCLAQRPKMGEVYKRIRALWEGYGSMSAASATLNSSMVCPVDIISEDDEIECLQ